MSVKRVAAAVFVKTPGYSPLKTRLAAELGTSKAEDFHRRAAECVQETLLQASGELASREVLLTPYWAVAEEAARDHPLWSGFQTISQGAGGLGARMHAVFDQLLERHEGVFLLGADSPQVSVRIIREAVKSLERHAFVLGPALDGGFYLLGGRRPIPLSVWERVPYSVPETAKSLKAELTALGEVAHLESLGDVDVRDDLPPLLPQLQTFSATNAQRQLAAWLEKILNTEN